MFGVKKNISQEKKLAFLFVRNELFNHTLNKHQHER